MNKIYKNIFLILLGTMAPSIYPMEQGSGGGKKEIEELSNQMPALLTNDIISEIRKIIEKSSSMALVYKGVEELLKWRFPQNVATLLDNSEFKKWLVDQIYEKFIPAVNEQKYTINEDDFYKAIELMKMSGISVDEAYEKFHQWLGEKQGQELLSQLVAQIDVGNEEKIKLLIELITYIRARKDRGKEVNLNELPPLQEGSYMPLDVAIMRNNLTAAQELLAMGYPIDIKGAEDKTALHRAAQRGNYQAALFLIQNGANVNVQDDDGYTPLQLAVGDAEYAVVELLLANGADPNIVNHAGNSAFDLAEEEVDEGAEEGVKENMEKIKEILNQYR